LSGFNPSRLVVARKRRGFTKKRLAEQAEVSTRVLNDYENSMFEPTPATLERIADVLEFPVTFFGGPDIEEPEIEATSFRALSRLTARLRDQALGSATLALELSRWIDDRYTLPAPDVPTLQGVDPGTAAEAVRREWGLGERSIKNVVHLLEAHGVRVFSLAEECAEVDAFSFRQRGVPHVFLNTMKSAERGRMDAAHELGHLVLHWGHETPKGREAEQQAQRFGSAFLMPRGSVLAQAPRGGRLEHLVKAKRHWGVSVIALAYRMHVLGLLSDWQYRAAMIEIGERGYRRDEPNPMPQRERSQVLAKVFDDLRHNGFTKADVAAELLIPAQELNKIVFGLVMTPVTGDGNGGEVSGERPELRLVTEPPAS
jgi:Zn-dependent peptidase ImmA (M78 family)/DNA-binding XRE family transcriptional regulator